MFINTTKPNTPTPSGTNSQLIRNALADPDGQSGHPGAEQNRQHGQRQASAGRRLEEDLRRQGLPEKRRPPGAAVVVAAAAVLIAGMSTWRTWGVFSVVVFGWAANL